MSLIKGFCRAVLTDNQYKGADQVNDSRVLIFTNNKPYPIRLEWYIEHILDQINLPEEILPHSYILVQKYLNIGLVCQYNIHKLVFTSLTICQKFILTPWISNESLEKVGGIKKGTLPAMESAFLHFVNWKLDQKKFQEIRTLLYHYSAQESAADDAKSEVTEEKSSEDFVFNEEFSHTLHSELGDFFSIESFENFE